MIQSQSINSLSSSLIEELILPPPPPLTGGNYFSAHYHLGHKKFQSAEPEVFLFGELSDINFLGSKPAAVRISFLMLCFSLSQFLTFLLLFSFPTSSLQNRSQSNALGVSSIFREIPLNSSSKHLRVLFGLCSMMTWNQNMTFCGMESGHSTFRYCFCFQIKPLW